MIRAHRKAFVLPAIGLAAALLALPAGGRAAGAEEIHVGVRANALQADPDIHGAGIAARFRLHEDWFVEATLDRQRYDADFARTALDSVVVGSAIGRRYGDGRTDWFWTWGIAAGFPDFVPRGDVAADAEPTAATEIHLTASLGIVRMLSERWSLGGALRVERHYVDWRAHDGDERLRRTSLTPAGLSVALNYRF